MAAAASFEPTQEMLEYAKTLRSMLEVTVDGTRNKVPECIEASVIRFTQEIKPDTAVIFTWHFDDDSNLHCARAIQENMITGLEANKETRQEEDTGTTTQFEVPIEIAYGEPVEKCKVAPKNQANGSVRCTDSILQVTCQPPIINQQTPTPSPLANSSDPQSSPSPAPSSPDLAR